jgi:TolB-like protein
VAAYLTRNRSLRCTIGQLRPVDTWNWSRLSGHSRRAVGYAERQQERGYGRAGAIGKWSFLGPSGDLVTASEKAVFLSYASQDSEAASRICEVLRAAGIEVWFDQSELRGGDAWDQMIRRQIKSCYLFVPIISANTQSREEGYFRREWKLGVDRTVDMAEDRAFLVPIVIDGTSDSEARVPEKFREVQWTRLLGGKTPPEFVRRIEHLLSGEVRASTLRALGPTAVASGRPSRAWLAAGVAVLVAAVSAYLFAERPWVAKPPPPAAFAPPARSIAVLPFANLSGDPSQEYFSDGLTEEILNALSTIEGLQVVARTSSFSFKGKDTDIGVIARRLNVGAVLEGSVRRSDHDIRVTAQLIDAVSGYHLWSKTYEDASGDVLKLQTEIANAVAQALQVTLQGDAYDKIALGGTNNLAAFDDLQQARRAYAKSTDTGDTKAFQDAIDAATDAIRLDPNYARALTLRAAAYLSPPPLPAEKIQEFNEKALADARQAIAVAPGYAGSHAALANYFENAVLDFAQADEEFERARALLEPTVCLECAQFSVFMGRFEPPLVALRRAVELNPLVFSTHAQLTSALYFSRRYQEAVGSAKQDISARPNNQIPYGFLGVAYYGLGDYEHARTTCEAKSDYWQCQQCLAVTYEKLGRHADAEAALAKLNALGDGAAYQNAAVYAQWGNVAKALEWLDTAMKLRDGGLLYLKTDPLMDPLRKEPRFAAVMRELKFPP